MKNEKESESRRSSRSLSRSHTNGTPLNDILSSRFPDEHGEVAPIDPSKKADIATGYASVHRSDDESNDDDDDDINEPDGVLKKEDEAEHSQEGNNEEIQGGVACERDVEADALEKKESIESTKDPNLVAWESASDPQNPKNWSIKRKWAAALIVSCFTLLSPVCSSMIAPALTSISTEFKITNEVEAQLTLSIFVLAYAIGPLFLGPLSEIYGRVIVLQLSNLFFLAWNLACE